LRVRVISLSLARIFSEQFLGCHYKPKPTFLLVFSLALCPLQGIVQLILTKVVQWIGLPLLWWPKIQLKFVRSLVLYEAKNSSAIAGWLWHGTSYDNEINRQRPWDFAHFSTVSMIQTLHKLLLTYNTSFCSYHQLVSPATNFSY
jgi:hypothetical protein